MLQVLHTNTLHTYTVSNDFSKIKDKETGKMREVKIKLMASKTKWKNKKVKKGLKKYEN